MYAILPSILSTHPKAASAHEDRTVFTPVSPNCSCHAFQIHLCSYTCPAPEGQECPPHPHPQWCGPCTGGSGSGSWNHAAGARGQFLAQTATGALSQGCHVAPLLPGLPPAPVPRRNSLSPVRSGQLNVPGSDFSGSHTLWELHPFALCDDQVRGIKEGQAGGKIATDPVGTQAFHLNTVFQAQAQIHLSPLGS